MISLLSSCLFEYVFIYFFLSRGSIRTLYSFQMLLVGLYWIHVVVINFNSCLSNLYLYSHKNMFLILKSFLHFVLLEEVTFLSIYLTKIKNKYRPNLRYICVRDILFHYTKQKVAKLQVFFIPTFHFWCKDFLQVTKTI